MKCTGVFTPRLGEGPHISVNPPSGKDGTVPPVHGPRNSVWLPAPVILQFSVGNAPHRFLCSAVGPLMVMLLGKLWKL